MHIIGFDNLEAFVRTHEEAARRDLNAYFFEVEPQRRYTGRLFERFSSAGDPFSIGASDFAATSVLSVSLSGKVIDGILDRQAEIERLLAIAADPLAKLWEVDPASEYYRAMSELYTLVRDINGIGATSASKLLASKRPHFVPIRDSVVEELLGRPKTWWEPWREALTNPGFVSFVEALPGPTSTSVLRKLDVVLWRHGTRVTRAAAEGI